MEKQLATEKIRALIAKGMTKVDLTERIGIARVTLDTRLAKSNWKKSELALIKLI